jgi:RNA polymerase sigma factor (sigma-70 family)
MVERFQGLVYSVPRRMGLGEEDAGDVFSETFAALVRSLDRIESGQALPKWLATTASREALRILRVRSTAPLGDLEETLAAEDRAVDESTVNAMRHEELREAVAELPGRCRSLLEMLFFEDAEYAQITERIGIPTGAIGPTRARCLDKLRRILESRQFFHEDVSPVSPVGSSKRR